MSPSPPRAKEAIPEQWAFRVSSTGAKEKQRQGRSACPKSTLPDGHESERVPGERGAEESRGGSSRVTRPPAGARGRQNPRGGTGWQPGSGGAAARALRWACRRHFIQTGPYRPPRACDPQSSAASAPPGPLYAGKGGARMPRSQQKRQAPSPAGTSPRGRGRGKRPEPRAPPWSRLPGSPGQHRLPHSPSVATVPASKSRQSLRPRASSSGRCFPRGLQPPRQSQRLVRKAIGARPRRGSPSARNFQEFHLVSPPRARRRLLPAGSAASDRPARRARARRPGAGEGARPPPRRPVRSPMRRASPSGRAAAGWVGRGRASGKIGGLMGAGSGRGSAPGRAAAERSPHSWTRRRLPSAGRPEAPATLLDAPRPYMACRGLAGATRLETARPGTPAPGVLPSPVQGAAPPSLACFCDS